MNLPKFTSLLGALLVTTNYAWADIPAATVTQTFNQVSHQAIFTGQGEQAKPGTVLQSGEYLKTGPTALAELKLANQTIARLGPNTAFAYSATTHQADLQSGTILFSKPKDGNVWMLKTSALTATVTGTTGFAEKQGNALLFGVIEGTVHLTLGTAKATLQAGQMLAVLPGSNPQIVAYDVPNFIKTSSLFSSFSSPLPNEKYIKGEIAQYNNLVSRGFIAPVKATLAPANNASSLAAGGNRQMKNEMMNASVFAGSSQGYTGSGVNLSLASGSSTSSSSLTLSGGVSGSSVSAAGSGTLLLAGSNAYSGSTSGSSGAGVASSVTTSGVVVNGNRALNSNGGTITSNYGGSSSEATLGSFSFSGSSGSGQLVFTPSGLSTGTQVTATGLTGTNASISNGNDLKKVIQDQGINYVQTVQKGITLNGYVDPSYTNTTGSTLAGGSTTGFTLQVTTFSGTLGGGTVLNPLNGGVQGGLGGGTLAIVAGGGGSIQQSGGNVTIANGSTPSLNITSAPPAGETITNATPVNIVNSTANPITFFGITVPAHGTATLPAGHHG